METILNLIRAHVGHPDLARLVDEPTTTLAGLRVNAFARIGLAMDIEDALGVTIMDDTMQGWNSVADVLRSVKGTNDE